MIDYLNLEDVAVQRGEKSDLLARKLVANGCYLYLWFDNNRKHKAMILFPGVSKKEMDYEFDQGTYPLTQGSREALIKILNRGENTTEGLEILIESDDGFKGFVTYQVRLTEEDKSVCVVVNPDDVAKLPPPSTFQTAPGSMYPGAPEKIFFENSEKETISGKHKPHTAYVALEKKYGTKRGDAWSKLKRLASESKGKNHIDLPGYGKIYLKRDKEKPETVLRYKHTEFERPDDGNQITKGSFNMAWTSEKQSKKKGNM
jgi:hypothetical protein